MPPAPLPSVLVDFLRRPHPAVIASVRPDGSPHTAATWYDWEEDGHVLLNMEATRSRLRFMRNDPRVALTVLEHGNWYRHVSLTGVVDRIEPDAELHDIDRLAIRYTGAPYGRRDAQRYSAWMHVHAWHAWNTNGPWEPR
jgi:PPOX class probable F420-dependent enzyme